MQPKVNTSKKTKRKTSSLKSIFYILMVLWTIIIISLLILMYNIKSKAIFDIAVKECKTAFTKDVQYRLWATKHGGVYVPETNETPPNPYLSHIAERDITTPSGKKLTLINPAYMTRQVFELGKVRFSIYQHITSLKPIRKENAPDEWEKNALFAFEAGSKEKIELLTYEGERHIRYMAPFKTEKGCLKCHAAQGYKVGEIRGGISISLPWQPFQDLFWEEMSYNFIGYLGIWFLGMSGLFIAYKRISRGNKVLESVYEKLKRNEENYRLLLELAPEAIFQGDDQGNFVTVNDKSCDLTGYTRDELLQMNMSDLFPNNVLIEKPLRYDQLQQGKIVITERELLRKDGKRVLVEMISKKMLDGTYESFMRDISERKKAVEDLIQSEKTLNTLLNGIHESALLIDVNGIILAANETVDQRINNGRKDLVGKNVYELLSPEVAERRKKYVASVIETAKPLHFQDRRLDRIIDNYLTPIVDESGKVIKIALVGIDVTENKIIEEQLIAKNKFIETILENAPIGFAVNKINDGEALLVSTRFYEIYGISEEEINTVDDFFEKVYRDPVFRSQIRERIMNDIMSGDPSRMRWKDIPITKKSGEKRYITAVNIPVIDQNLMVSTVQDTTDRKLAEIELQKSEERFRQISSSISDISYSCVVESNGKSTINWLYGAVFKITGYTEEEVFEMKCWGNLVLKDDFLTFKKHIIDVTPGSTKICQLRIQRKDGRIVWIQATAQCVKSEINSSDMIVYGGLVDITERKLSELELEKYRDHLEELVKLRTSELDNTNQNLTKEIKRRIEAEERIEEALEKEKQLSQLKSRFISTASHEFRTPLTSILTSTELIQRYKEKWNDEKIDEHLSRIKNSVDSLTRLMDDVLLVNRAESGKIIYSPTSTDLFNLCGKVIEDVKFMAKPTHNVILNFGCDIKNFVIDPKQMELILNNLLTNAIKYSPDGGNIEMKVSYEKNELNISVSDQGIGIPQQDLPRLFEAFHRSKNTKDVKGTGLGLSIVKHAVDIHSGKIDVVSTEGKGTTFFVKIPIQEKY